MSCGVPALLSPSAESVQVWKDKPHHVDVQEQGCHLWAELRHPDEMRTLVQADLLN